MAYDEALADRVRELLSARADVSERKMFGGIAFMIDGNMAVGVLGEDLIVRIDPADTEQAIVEDGVREFDFTGRPAKGMVYVAPEVTAVEAELAGWVEAGADRATSLPPK
ncbi:MAG TPA: TfoX/Sxy family protein [Solirubrobacterales bacterium]|nr:TfoX/Sxy family protein [Solirubrobacterales bacterium]